MASGNNQGEMPSRFYHYTDRNSDEAIRNEGVIRQSVGNGPLADAAYGNGVYVTPTPPQCVNRTIVQNNYDSMAQRMPQHVQRHLESKTETYFKFTPDQLPNVQRTSSDRNVWVVPNSDVHLTGKTRNYGVRKNYQK